MSNCQLLIHTLLSIFLPEMNGTVITGTPIAVDFWRWRQCPNSKVFFLSHGHSDHTSGLTSTWREPIYCSEITGRIAVAKCGVKESLIKTLTVGDCHIIPLDDIGKETMTVTLLDANHCPGATMFLFEGYFGRILYTGDFRYHSSMCSNLLIGHGCTIDRLYLDNTYNNSSCDFPSEFDCRMKILEILASSPYQDIVIGMHQLGKEDLLVDIARFFEDEIQVLPERLSMINLLDCEPVFTTQERRIRVVPVPTITRNSVEQWTSDIPTVVIIPSAIFEVHRQSKLTHLQDVHIVPHSSHSSYSELIKFVRHVKPRKVIPIVNPPPSKGKECSIADVSNFDPYRDTTPATTFSIPPSVEKYMMSTSQYPVKIPCLKRKRSSISTAAKGVVFEDDDDDDDDEMDAEGDSGENNMTPKLGTADNCQKCHDCVSGTPSKLKDTSQAVPGGPEDPKKSPRSKHKKLCSCDNVANPQGAENTTAKGFVFPASSDNEMVHMDKEKRGEKGDSGADSDTEMVQMEIEKLGEKGDSGADSDTEMDIERIGKKGESNKYNGPSTNTSSTSDNYERSHRNNASEMPGILENAFPCQLVSEGSRKSPSINLKKLCLTENATKLLDTEISTTKQSTDDNGQKSHSNDLEGDTPSKSKSPTVQLKKFGMRENTTQPLQSENRTSIKRITDYFTKGVSDMPSKSENTCQSIPEDSSKPPRIKLKRLHVYSSQFIAEDSSNSPRIKLKRLHVYSSEDATGLPDEMSTERPSEKSEPEAHNRSQTKRTADSYQKYYTSSRSENTCQSVPKESRKSPIVKLKLCVFENATTPCEAEKSTPSKIIADDCQISQSNSVGDTLSKSRKSPSVKLKKLHLYANMQPLGTENVNPPRVVDDSQKFSRVDVSDASSKSENISQSVTMETRKSPRKMHKKMCSCENTCTAKSAAEVKHMSKCGRIVCTTGEEGKNFPRIKLRKSCLCRFLSLKNPCQSCHPSDTSLQIDITRADHASSNNCTEEIPGGTKRIMFPEYHEETGIAPVTSQISSVAKTNHASPDFNSEEMCTDSHRTLAFTSPVSDDSKGTGPETTCDPSNADECQKQRPVQNPSIDMRKRDFRMNCYRAMKKFFDRVKADEIT